MRRKHYTRENRFVECLRESWLSRAEPVFLPAHPSIGIEMQVAANPPLWMPGPASSGGEAPDQTTSSGSSARSASTESAQRETGGDYSFGMRATPQPWANLGPWLGSTGQSLYSAVQTGGRVGLQRTSTGRPVLDSQGRAVAVRSNAVFGSDIGQSVLGGAAGLAGMTGQAGLAKSLAIAASGAGTVGGALRRDTVGATLSGLGGVAGLVGGKAGGVLSRGIEVAGTARSVIGHLGAKGIEGVSGAIGSAAGLAAGLIKGVGGKVLSGLSTAATVSLQAARAVASGAISLASGVAGGAFAGIGAIASLVGGRIGSIVGNVATIVAAALMSNPIGAVIGGIALIASFLFRPKGRFTSDQRADLLGRAATGNGTTGPVVAGAATAALASAVKPPPLDRLHRSKNNTLEVYINDDSGKETKTQTLKMGGYFAKKNQAGQDKLIDLLDRGAPDILWQGDKKAANHITEYANLGGGKFGDPLAPQKAAKSVAAMEEYIRTHPKPTFDGTSTTNPGILNLRPGFNSAKEYQAKIMQQANAWLNGLEAAVNCAVDAKNPNMSQLRSTMTVVENSAVVVHDQSKVTGVYNSFKDMETQLRNPQDDSGTLYVTDDLLPAALRDSGFTGRSPTVAPPGCTKAETGLISSVIDQGVKAMRQQLAEQAKPEGRVFNEQTLNIKIKNYQPEQLKFSDVNSDGIPDVIVSGKGVQKGTWVFLGQGDGRFAEKGIDVSAELEALKSRQGASTIGA